MLMTQAELGDLHQYLIAQIHADGDENDPIGTCDHTLKHTRAWLKTNKKTLRDNLRAIGERGGYCDCEVLLNVSVSRWPEQDNSQRPAA
jgi:hypothetical protein